MERTFCPECMAMREYDVIDRQETYPVRGDDVTVDARVAVCRVCANDIGMTEFDDAALQAAFSVYRARHDLLQPEQIREIRSRYGLGQKAFARLLGWGDVTLARYETGSLQSEAHDATLRLVEDPQNVRRLLDLNHDKLSAEQVATVEARLDGLAAGHGALLAREESASYSGASGSRPVVRVSASQARRDFSKILDRVTRDGEHIVVTRNGTDVAAVVSIEDLQALALSPESYDAVVDLIEYPQPATAALRELMRDE
ncbi:MAG: type II TA system antitoxin MqsA family protein [Coriobacteriia bacterium]